MSTKQNLVGQRFERLTVVSDLGNTWECRCECGARTAATSAALLSGHKQSCGCLHRERFKDAGDKARFKHGDSGSPEYQAWNSMRHRCANPKASGYARYGGRGIKVCDRWKDSYENFLEDMGRKPKPARLYSLERKDVSGDYTPENCIWADRFQQANNRRSSRYIEAFGKRQTLKQWSRETGLHVNTIKHRIDRLKWPVEQALNFTPDPIARTLRAA